MSPEKNQYAYIHIHKDLLDFIDKLVKEKKLVEAGQDLIRLGIITALAIVPNTPLPRKKLAELTRDKGARNFNSIDIDKEGTISFLIENYTEEQDVQTYRKMELLANKGLALIKDKYLDENYLIKWKELEKKIKS